MSRTAGQRLRQWGNAPLGGDTAAGLAASLEALDRTHLASVVSVMLTGCLGVALIGPWALAWMLPVTGWLLVAPTAERRLLALLGLETDRRGALAVLMGIAATFHIGWTVLPLAVWVAAPDGLGAMGYVLALALAVHVVVNHRNCAPLMLACLAGPVAGLGAMAVLGTLEGAWPWLAGTALLFASLAGVVADQTRTATRLRRALELAGQRLADLEHAVEQARMAETAAREADAAKTNFLATMSHEIRTPMNAVLGTADLIAREEISPTVRARVDTMRGAGRLLLAILNDLLDLSKIEAGRMEVERVAVNPEALLRDVEALWRPRADDKGLTLSLVLDPGLPPAIETDPVRLQQILFNLVSNALKFTEAGAVTITARVRVSPAGTRRLVIAVTDTGIGIAPDHRERIFSPYAQADSAIGRRFGGTGLGLAIGRRLAEALGGELGVASTPGAGSCFTLSLPLVEVEAPGPGLIADTGAGDRPGLAILVVEDHPVNRTIVEALLVSMGHRVMLAEDGAVAVEIAARHRFDAVLMDVNMPVMDGLTATRTIRAGGGPNAATPIIALTADAFDGRRREGEGAGMDAYLTKPIDPRLLATVLNRVTSVTQSAA
jgi:signal transduction histidine kinase/ActR/RegA family two-component response regulator